jgi:hypothetical protein
MTGHNGTSVSPLRQALTVDGYSLTDLTVLDEGNDPFRADAPAGHRDGAWLAATAADLGLGGRRIHLRGLHYMVIGRPKPDGVPYANTDKDWKWLHEKAGKAARWLGYIPFDQITDQRNAEPAVRKFTRPDPWPYITVGIDVDLPAAATQDPRAMPSRPRHPHPAATRHADALLTLRPGRQLRRHSDGARTAARDPARSRGDPGRRRRHYPPQNGAAKVALRWVPRVGAVPRTG